MSWVLGLMLRNVREYEELVEERVKRQLELMEKVRCLCMDVSFKCRGVLAVVLFGSLARLEYGEKSDIDVLFITAGKDVEECIYRETSGKEPYITPLVLTIDEWRKVREEFRLEVISDGVILYASGIGVKELIGYEPYVLLKYSTKGLSSSEKSRIAYMVSGARVKGKNGRYYRSKSLLEKMGGIKVGEGTILIPYKYAEEFTAKLLKLGAKIEKQTYVLAKPRKQKT